MSFPDNLVERTKTVFKTNGSRMLDTRAASRFIMRVAYPAFALWGQVFDMHFLFSTFDFSQDVSARMLLCRDRAERE